jgi:hypothetical protein
VGATIALICFAPAVIAWSRAARMETLPESRLWVTGTSTVRTWECKATAFDEAIESLVPDATAGVLDAKKSVGTVKLTVPVEKMDCKNGTMNEHMRKALKANEFPAIVFTLDSYELSKAENQVRVTMKGELALGGVTKSISIDASAAATDSGALRVSGVYPLNMKEYGLKPPSLMLGTMRVGEIVKVNFDLLLKN